MSIWQGFQSYYRLFGVDGVLLLTRSRLQGRPIEARVEAPGILHPMYVRFRTTDISAFEQVIGIREYDFDCAPTPKVIVDAGANIGLTSVFYANKYPLARIISIEPEESNFRLLKKNAAAYPNITPVHAALWGEDASLKLVDAGLGNYGFQIKANDGPGAGGGPQIPATTIKTIMTEFRLDFIDLLKIDIEGSEKEVFELSSGWIDKVGMIAVELHDRLKPGCSDAVYSAVKDFECEWQNGETIFFTRNGKTRRKDGPISTAAQMKSWKFRVRNAS